VPDAAHLARWYLLALAAGLLLEGVTMLLIGSSGAAAGLPFSAGDPRHNALHAVWGAGLLILLAFTRRPGALLLGFGVFYTALAFAGVLVDRPFGLLLGPGENVFHFIVGPTALALGVLTVTRRRGRRAAAQPAPARTS
jgi:hypothetical protein